MNYSTFVGVRVLLLKESQKKTNPKYISPNLLEIYKKHKIDVYGSPKHNCGFSGIGLMGLQMPVNKFIIDKYPSATGILVSRWIEFERFKTVCPTSLKGGTCVRTIPLQEFEKMNTYN